MTYMRFCVMDVGQGSANYIELRGDNGRLVAAAIVNIGSEQWKRTAGEPAAEWIADQLKEMNGGPELETVTLSHSDSDHVNLIPSLLGFFAKPSDKNPVLPVLTVKNVTYGGNYAKYSKRNKPNFIKQLTAYRPREAEEDAVKVELANDYSSFNPDDSDRWLPIAELDGEIDLWAVTANTTAAKVPGNWYKQAKLPDGGFAINTSSIVVAATFGGKTLIATGDATGLTIAHCNEVLKKQGVSEFLGLPAAHMLTLPHHGSDTTTYSLTGAKGHSEAAEAVVKTFSELVKASTISGSAGEKRTFRHPSARVIDHLGAYMMPTPEFIDPALEEFKEHFYTAYFFNQKMTVHDDTGATGGKWPRHDGWQTVRSDKNLYTTDYTGRLDGRTVYIAYPWTARRGELNDFTPVPSDGISWGFIVHDDGRTELTRVLERTAANAAYLAAVEAVRGPLPEGRWVEIRSAPRDASTPGDASAPRDATAPPSAPEPPRFAPPPPPPGRLRQLP